MANLRDVISTASGALIVYPFALNRKHLVSLLARDINASTVVSDSVILDVAVVSYSDFDAINAALHRNGVVLFDSAPMLAMIVPALTLQDITAIPVILTTWGDAPSHVNLLTTTLSLIHLSVDIVSAGQPVHWKVVTVPMSQSQVTYYDTVRTAETVGNLSARNQPYPATRMVTLYHYPLDNTIDLTGTMCRAELPERPDILDHASTWLEVGYLPTLEEDGPKLAALVDSVLAAWPQKQIILSQFTHRYGVDLIAAVLRLLSRDHKSPYHESEIFPVQCSDDYERYRARFVEFEQAETGILITNVVPPIPLHHVGIIHVVDSYAYTPIIMTLQRVHQRHLTSGPVTVFLYVATHPQEASADQVLIDRFKQQIQQADTHFNHLVSDSRRIVFAPSKGLVVEETKG